MISIHALLAESDYLAARQPDHLRHFYPRSPCGERLEQSASYNTYLEISIHALLAESDQHAALFIGMDMISIHALLAESDAMEPAAQPRAAISIHALLAESDGHRASRD